MGANKASLLILKRPRGRLRIEPIDELSEGKLDAPIDWLLRKRFRDAKLLDSSLRLSSVEGAKFVSIAGPGAWGGLDFSYVLLLLIGWLTLATPIWVRISLTEERQFTLDEARHYIDKIVNESRLDPDVKQQLSKRIRRAKSVDAMARAIDDARE